MKKLLYLLLLVPFALMTSCNKDDDFAPFDMTLTLSGVSQVDGTFYAVQGDEVSIDNLQVSSQEKQTAVANVMFYVDGMPLFVTPWNVDQPLTFSTANLAPGTHNVNVSGNLLQVDQSIMEFAVNYKLVVVDSQENLPSEAPATGTYSQTINFTSSK